MKRIVAILIGVLVLARITYVVADDARTDTEPGATGNKQVKHVESSVKAATPTSPIDIPQGQFQLLKNAQGTPVAIGVVPMYADPSSKLDWGRGDSTDGQRVYESKAAPTPTGGYAISSYPTPEWPTPVPSATPVSTPQQVMINHAGSGSVTLVGPSGATRVRVHGGYIICAGATTLTWLDSAGATLVGPQAVAANTGYMISYVPEPLWLFSSPVSTGLALNSSAAVVCGGVLNHNQY